MRVTRTKASNITIFDITFNKNNSFTTYKLTDRPRDFMVKFNGKDIVLILPLKYRNKIRNAYYTAKHHVERQLSRLDHRTQYYINWGRDCDGCESTRAVKFSSAYDALESIDAAYEWADGPESWDKCTKAEYEEFQPTFRDLGLEAYENGHPHVLRP